MLLNRLNDAWNYQDLSLLLVIVDRYIELIIQQMTKSEKDLKIRERVFLDLLYPDDEL
jgi:hypothetical protein